jgi:PAS domain S-box-containing protein
MNNVLKNSGCLPNLTLTHEQILDLINALPLCIAYADSQQKYRFVNQAYQDWFGVKLEDIEGKHIKEVMGEFDSRPKTTTNSQGITQWVGSYIYE